MAAREAGRVTDGGVTDSRAHAVRGYAFAALRMLGASSREFQAALKGDPRNWRVRRDWARVLLALGDRRAAQAQMALALALNPRMPLPPGFARGSHTATD